MPSLLEIQTRFAAAIRDRSHGLPEDLFLMDGMPVETRLDVYRNNVFVSLQDLLAERFPAVSRVVHERFFLYAADAFIRTGFPEKPVLSRYGAGFPDFLANFPPCRSLAYLPDLARLEWLVFRAAAAPAPAALESEGLRSCAPEDLGRLVFDLDPSLGLLESPWPVDRLWRGNQPGSGDDTLRLEPGEVFLEVRRVAGDVGFRRLPKGVFAFRSALLASQPLQHAAEAAQTADPTFDLAAALADMVREEVLTAARLVAGDPKDE